MLCKADQTLVLRMRTRRCCFRHGGCDWGHVIPVQQSRKANKRSDLPKREESYFVVHAAAAAACTQRSTWWRPDERESRNAFKDLRLSYSSRSRPHSSPHFDDP